MLKEVIESFKSDLELAGCQLVLAGLKSASKFEVLAGDYPKLDFKMSLFYKAQDDSDSNIHWYIFSHKKELHVYVVDRSQCKAFDSYFGDSVFKKDIPESCFEQMIMKNLWGKNYKQFGICLGYPIEVAEEFEKELKTNKLRKDRVKNLFFYTTKDQVGFVTYPEYIIESTKILVRWELHMSSLRVRTSNKYYLMN